MRNLFFALWELIHLYGGIYRSRSIRFIAVNDCVDSADGENEPAPFRNVMNEMYARDISRKVRSSHRLRGSISDLDSMQTNKDKFINAIRKFMEMQRLSAPLLRERIDHIDVYETEGTGKNRTQHIMIHYKFVGVIEIPDSCDNDTADTRQGVAVRYVTKCA